MKFDVTTSKLYQQIMEAAAGFFGLDTATTTETEIHAAFDGQKPFAEQLREAQTAANADIQKQLDDMKADATKTTDELATLQTQFEAMQSENATKDQRITELQKQIADGALATESLKTQHQKEIANLAGELAKSKVGKSMEADAGGDTHDAGKPDKGSNGVTEVIVAKSSALTALTKKSAGQ